MLVCSVDIGIKNYAYSIIVCDQTECSNPFGSMCVVTADKLCLTEKRIKDQAALLRACRVLTTHFDENMVLQGVDAVLIESQLPGNPVCMKLGMHTASYFMIRHPNAKIHYVSPKIRLRVMGDVPPGHTSGPSWKRLSVERVHSAILQYPEQYRMLAATLELHREKQDDLCDSICQCAAWLAQN